MPVRELHEAFTLTAGEIAWAREQTRTPEHLMALVVLLDAWRGARADLASADVGRVPAGSPWRMARWTLTGSLSRAVSFNCALGRRIGGLTTYSEQAGD